jgi:hypothetical protein
LRRYVWLGHERWLAAIIIASSITARTWVWLKAIPAAMTVAIAIKAVTVWSWLICSALTIATEARLWPAIAASVIAEVTRLATTTAIMPVVAAVIIAVVVTIEIAVVVAVAAVIAIKTIAVVTIVALVVIVVAVIAAIIVVPLRAVVVTRRSVK